MVQPIQTRIVNTGLKRWKHCWLSSILLSIRGGQLSEEESKPWQKKYRTHLEKADKECPPPYESQRKVRKRGRLERSKARNLLERLRNFEQNTLRFMAVDWVPFTNNQVKKNLRMTKVQQTISGCFRSMEGAKIFCRVRSYLPTCRKQGVSATVGLGLLFQGRNSEFMNKDKV